MWGQRQNNLYLSSGTDKPIHQAASGAQSEALTPTCWRIYWSCSGTRKPPSWLLFSGSLSMLYSDSLSLLVMLVSVTVLSFVPGTISHAQTAPLQRNPYPYQQTTQWQKQGIAFSLLTFFLFPFFHFAEAHCFSLLAGWQSLFSLRLFSRLGGWLLA